DDVAELLLVGEPPLRVELQLELRVARRLCTDLTSRDLHILFADRVDDVSGRQVAGGQLLRVEPDAHSVVAATEYAYLAHAGQARQHIAYVQYGIVAQVQSVIPIVRR